MENIITYLKVKEQENTKIALELAVKTARELGIKDIVFASTVGGTAKMMADEIEREGLNVTVVTHAFNSEGKNPMDEELRSYIKEKGINVLTAGHALSSGERSLSGGFGGVYPLEIIANTLRMFGQGTKVCVEIGAMAADAGIVKSGEPIVAVGGTGRGADTVIVLRPQPSSTLIKTKIDKIICKPLE